MTIFGGPYGNFAYIIRRALAVLITLGLVVAIIAWLVG